MFSLFKKKIHEPVEHQKAELLSHPVGPLALSGEDCDEISGGEGPFGHSYNNPIPVNGQLGTYKYLAKLRIPQGTPLLFHRIGSMGTDKSKYSVDVYEIVDSSGKYWDILFVDMYHPRRSNKAPMGYKLAPFNPKAGDHFFALGVDVFCPNFPYDLPDAIVAHNGFESVAKIARDVIGVTSHLRHHQQEMKLAMIKTQLQGARVWGSHQEHGY